MSDSNTTESEQVEASRIIGQYMYWVNADNTLALKLKGEWPEPPEGDWHEVDLTGYQFVVDQIGELQRAAILAVENMKSQDKIERLIAAGLSPEAAKILVDQ